MRKRALFPLFITLLVMIQGCSSVPLLQRDDPDDRLKGIRKEAEEIRYLGERYWIRALSFWDKNDIVRRLKKSASELGQVARNDKDQRVKAAAEEQLENLYKTENPLVRLVAFHEIKNQQTVKQAALHDKLIEVRSIAAGRLTDAAILAELSRSGDVVGRLARIRLGLLDPVMQKHLHPEPGLLVESETRQGRFNDVKMEGYFTTISIKAVDKLLAQGEEHTIIKWKSPLAPGQVQMSNVGHPLGGNEVLAKVKAQDGKRAGEVKQVDLNPSEILYNVLTNSSFSPDGAKEIVRTTNSDDLKQAAIRHLKNRK